MKTSIHLGALLIACTSIACGDDAGEGAGGSGGATSASSSTSGTSTTTGGGGSGGSGGDGGGCEAGEPPSSIVASFTVAANGGSFDITECNSLGCGDPGRVSRVIRTADDLDDFVTIVCYGDEGSVSLAYRARTGAWTDYDSAQADLGVLAAVVTFDPYVPFTTPSTLDLELTTWDATTNTTAGSIAADYGNGVSITGSWSGSLADCRGNADPTCGQLP